MIFWTTPPQGQPVPVVPEPIRFELTLLIAHLDTTDVEDLLQHRA